MDNSFLTSIQFSFKSFVRTQSHFLSFHLKVPSKTSQHQQEGDLDLRIASLHHFSFATLSASLAQYSNSQLKSSQSADITLSPNISHGTLGDGSHHIISGQTGKAFPDLTKSIISCFGQELQSNLHCSHARQALTRIILSSYFISLIYRVLIWF